MTISEKCLSDLKRFISKVDSKVLIESRSGNIFENLQLVNEAEGGLTYYELRQFLAVLLKQTTSSDVKRIIDNILKTVSKLEIMRVPVPAIKKQKSISPSIFK